ncbi:HNH endonuclease [Cryobacterium arcticum]|uniref:HNH nuclease domain-containing protein n=1 Tax=Cryobacterium arcticum TaxID=670052 RepID=A0A1B1BKB5_9MICO|nr:HNH endonuclease [Cryobacterium arcticum]ANP73030.1 hypothetical protein PA27867_2078 [Cryobacterium arcticum]
MASPDIQISFETAPAAPTPAEKFAARYGRPIPATAESDAVWAAQKLPTSAPLRRLAAEYLWAGECAGICAVCESPIDLQFRGNHPGAPTLDRIVPREDGGDYVWGNLRVLHRSCNEELAEGNLPVSVEWARELLSAKMRGVAGELTRSDILRIQITHAARRLVEVRAELAGAGLSADATEERLRWQARYQEQVDNWPGVADLWERQARDREAGATDADAEG